MGKPCSTQSSLDMADAYLTWHANALVVLSLVSMVGNGIKSVVSYCSWIESRIFFRLPVSSGNPLLQDLLPLLFIFMPDGCFLFIRPCTQTHTVAEGITRKLLSIVVDVRYRNLLPTLPVSVHVFILERFLSSLYICECLSCLLCENWWRNSCGWEPELGAILFLCLLGSFLGCIRETHTTLKESHDDDVITIGLNYGGCSLWHAPLRLLFSFSLPLSLNNGAPYVGCDDDDDDAQSGKTKSHWKLFLRLFIYLFLSCLWNPRRVVYCFICFFFSV